MQRKHEPEVWKGVLAGVAGGLVASWSMNQVFAIWNKYKKSSAEPEQSSQKGVNTDPATLQLAQKLSQEFLHHKIPDRYVRQAETAVHYGFGTLSGGVYGALAEYVPQAKAAAGTAFGAALFITADEIAVPLMGLSGKPNEVPKESHVLGLTAHIVYGITTELVRKGTRRLLAA
ncbi:MAG TPA: DUF1440 domain-containing protein [Candidatus Angelobacter sp.]|nr:DUF1440 domain-containing protein [Candidatus Angelobacter sp.]